MLHIISLLFSNWIWKILSEIIVYVNVTHNITVILKLNMKNLKWDNCLCKCYTSYHCYSQIEYEKSWVR
jgi:hypothetical protein